MQFVHRRTLADESLKDHTFIRLVFSPFLDLRGNSGMLKKNYFFSRFPSLLPSTERNNPILQSSFHWCAPFSPLPSIFKY